MEWTVKYEANELPDMATPVWDTYGSFDTAEIVDGKLHLASSAYADYSVAPSIPGDCTVEVKIKCVSAEAICFDVGNDDVSYYFVEVTPTQVNLGGGVEVDSYVMDTTDDYHIYRLLIESNIAKLYIDGVLRITLDDPYGAFSGYVGMYLNSGEGYIDYYYYRTDGAFTPDGWNVQYEANELPEEATPAWETNYSPDPLEESTVEISPAGILHIIGVETDPGSTEAIAWSIEPDFDDAVGATLEFRMQMVTGDLMVSASGEHYLAFYTDNSTEALIDFYTDGIELNGEPYAFDTTDGLHTYRLTVKDHEAKLYVDGVLRIEHTLGEEVGWGFIELCIVNGSSDSEQNWDYIYWDETGAYAPPMDWEKVLDDLLSFEESLETASAVAIERALSDSLLPSETLSKLVNKILADSQEISGDANREIALSLSDTFVILDDLTSVYKIKRIGDLAFARTNYP